MHEVQALRARQPTFGESIDIAEPGNGDMAIEHAHHRVFEQFVLGVMAHTRRDLGGGNLAGFGRKVIL